MSNNFTQKMPILIIDDNEKLCASLRQSFIERGYIVSYALNGQDALSLYKKNNYYAVVLDVKLGSENGIDVLQKLIEIKKTPVIMLTGYGTIETAVTSIKLGAYDYLNKPVKFEKLLTVVENATRVKKLENENIQLKKRIIDYSSTIITNDIEMKNICKKAAKIAESDLPILITGESGTGKEVLADFVHANSSRAYKEMIKINCASFPESLLDNELFGHDKGAFTGANSSYKGVFEQADGSTLFLDELGDMPLSIQAKILRTMQNHEIRRLGGKENIKVDVRFITATNKNLKTLIENKTFREDLFYRLNSAVLNIPSLRDRKEDIDLLVDYFIHEFKKDKTKTDIEIKEEVKKIFLDYDWPGNVRELKNCVQYALAVSDDDKIELENLPAYMINDKISNTESNVRERIEKKLLLKTLDETGFNKKKTAGILSMSRATLYNKLEKYGIPIDRNK